MNRRRTHRTGAHLLALVFTLGPTVAWAAPAAEVEVSDVFSDHMVLQRDRRVPVWGTGRPGGTVAVTLDGAVARAEVGPDRRWRAWIPARPAGGPYALEVRGTDTVTFHDVVVGEVWLASGQSNMEMSVEQTGKIEVDDPGIRLLTLAHRVEYGPVGDPRTDGWQRGDRDRVRGFSAAAYHFARELRRELGVPVGLIQAAWGGTEIESWMSPEALARVPAVRGRLAQVEDAAALGSPEARRDAFRSAYDAWRAAIPREDRGSNATPHWSSPSLDSAGWRTMALPSGWENAGLPDLDGVVWFRRRVDIPTGWAGQELELRLGRIDDADTTWFDGVAVGTDSVYDRPRAYRVPARLVTPGPHTITVRVFDWIGGGGLWGDADMMALALPEAGSIPLAGDWSFRVGLDLAELPARPRDPDDPNQPGVLSNGMIAPLVPYALRGVLWYQGEANASRAHEYRTLFPGLIHDWRARWGQGDFPFLFVQLAGFLEPAAQPGESDWAELREAQAMALSRPHTGMAVAYDIGDARDIHPRDKQAVGRRLALAALDVAYHRPVTASGPRFRALRIDGRTARVRFDHAPGDLIARGGGGPRGFALAGADRVFHWADARIEGDEVVLTSGAVPEPVAVRHAWATHPLADLTDASGLPAPPFRTDRWPGVTEPRPRRMPK